MNKVSQRLYGIKGLIKSEVNRKIAVELLDFGADILRSAIESKEFTNRTYNLISSYGIGLFVDGREWKGQMAHPEALRGLFCEMDYPGRIMSNVAPGMMLENRFNPLDGTEGNAYDYLDRFFDEYQAPKGKWQLVLVAAMFYGSAVEAKGYDVISQVSYEMASSEVARKYKGVIKNVPNRWMGGSSFEMTAT